MGPKELTGRIQRGAFLPVYLFYGQDDFLIEQAAAQLCEAVLHGGDSSFNCDVFSGNEHTAGSVVAAANALPLLSERRFVMVRSAEKIWDKPPLPAYIQSPSPTTVLLLWAGESWTARKKGRARVKNGAAIDVFPLLEERDATVLFKSMSDAEAESWIADRLGKAGKRMTPPATKILLTLKGTSARQLHQEVEKIIVGLGERTEASEGDVYDLIGVSREYNIFELSERLGRRDAQQSMVILLRLLEMQESPIGIVYALVRHFIDLWKVKILEGKNGRPTDSRKAELKLPDWQIGKLAPQSRLFTSDELRACFTALLEAEIALKSSGPSREVVMTRLVHQLSRRAG